MCALRLSELRGSAAINYAQQFSTRPIQRRGAARDGRDGDVADDEDDGDDAVGECGSQRGGAVDKSRFVGYWYSNGRQKVFTTPSGQRLTGSAAYNASRRLREQAIKKGLIPQTATRPRKKKGEQQQRQQQLLDGDVGDDAPQDRAQRTERKPSAERKARKARKASKRTKKAREGAAAASDDGDGAVDSARKAAKGRARRTSRSASAERRRARPPRAKVASTGDRRVSPPSSDSEAEWVPGTAPISTRASDASEDDIEEGDEDEDMRGFIVNDDEDDFVDI